MTTCVCVFGANGYLGRHIVRQLLSEPQVYRLQLSDKHTFSFDGHQQYCQIDVRDAQAVNAMVAKCDYVFYFAGLTGTTQGFESFREFIEINEIGLLNVLDGCRRHDRKPKIIFPSSRLVYKGKRDVTLKEDDEKEFKTPYALNKYAGEQYLKMYAHCFGVRYTVLRICVPYGTKLAGGQSYGTLSHFVSQARENGEIVIFGDGVQKRTFIHIEDLARIILEASFSSATDNDVFNIGGADSLSIRYVAESIARKFAASVRYLPWPEFAEKIESGDTVFSSAKLEAVMKVEYHHTFDLWLETEETLAV